MYGYDFRKAHYNLWMLMISAVIGSVFLALVADAFAEVDSNEAGSIAMIDPPVSSLTVSTYPSIIVSPVTTSTPSPVVVTDPSSVESQVVAVSTIVIPDPCKYDNTNRYIIESNDTLWNIANLYQVSIEDIVGCNQWQDGSSHFIYPGDEIILPPDLILPTTTTTSPSSSPPPPPSSSVSIPSSTTPQPSPSPVTTSPPPPPPPSADGRSTHPQCPWETAIRSAWASIGASVDAQDRAVAIAWRESGCQQGAHNPNRATRDNSYGLFQLNMLPGALGPLMTSWGFGPHNLLDGNQNIRAAVQLYAFCSYTFGPWTKPYSWPR